MECRTRVDVPWAGNKIHLWFLASRSHYSTVDTPPKRHKLSVTAQRNMLEPARPRSNPTHVL